MSKTKIQQAEITRLLALVDTSEPWPILEVDIKTCTFDDVKKSYRKKAHLIHPDRCQLPKGKEAFQVLDAAYQKVASEKNLKDLKTKSREKKNEESKAASKGAVDPADVKGDGPTSQHEQVMLRAVRDEESRRKRKRRREEEEAKNKALNDHLHKLNAECVDFGS